MGKRATTKHPYEGRWRITWMEQWDQEYVDEEVEGFIEFEPKGHGSFQYGYVQGNIDHRPSARDSEPCVEFSWEGGDGADGTPLTGRGWAALDGEGLKGEFVIHDGDESAFRAARKKAKRK